MRKALFCFWFCKAIPRSSSWICIARTRMTYGKQSCCFQQDANADNRKNQRSVLSCTVVLSVTAFCWMERMNGRLTPPTQTVGPCKCLLNSALDSFQWQTVEGRSRAGFGGWEREEWLGRWEQRWSLCPTPHTHFASTLHETPRAKIPTHFFSRSFLARALHSGHLPSFLYISMHLFSLLWSSLVNFSKQDKESHVNCNPGHLLLQSHPRLSFGDKWELLPGTTGKGHLTNRLPSFFNALPC